MRRTGRAMVVLAVVLSCCREAPAGEFKSSKGFTIHYPDGWVVASEEFKEQINQESQSRFSNLKDVDLGQVAVFIYNSQGSGFAQNLNVVVTRGEVKPTAENERKAMEEAAKAMRAMGIVPTNTRSGRTTAAGREAIWIRHDVQFPGLPEPIHQWQAYVPGSRRTFIVTCTARASEFGEYEPTFRQMLDTMEIDGGLLAWLTGLPTWAIGALGGLVIGGLIGLVKALNKRKARPVFAAPAPPGLGSIPPPLPPGPRPPDVL